MSSLSTNFNVPPYFDDYEEAKRYYRILFRPSVAVQARELTQSQTIQQDQVKRFADSIYKNGGIVEGCTPAVLPDLNFVRVADQFTANANYSFAEISPDYLLVGQTSNVRATVVLTKTGSLAQYPNTNRFYLNYVYPGVNDKQVFDSNELIKIYNASQNKFGEINEDNLINTIQTITANSTVNTIGTGYGMKIENGIIYQKGFFQIVSDQIIIVKDYDQNVANYVVGFETIEEIITENDDESLNDNALGYSNENAPGSHRLKLTPVAVARDRTQIKEDDSFFSLYEFSNISNRLLLNKSKSSYDELGEVLSLRTFEESGDYVTKQFRTEAVELDDPTKFAYEVSSGVGYVRGNRIEYLSSNRIEVDKANETLEAQQQNITTNYGSYVVVRQLAGALNFPNFITIDIHDQPHQAITKKFNNPLSGTKVGTAKVKAILHNEGDPGAFDTTYRLYITDIVMNSGKSFINDAKSFYASSAVNTPYGAFFADIVLYESNTKAILQETNKVGLVFPIGKTSLKTLRSGGGAINDTSFYFRNASLSTLQTDGTIAVTIPSSATGGIDKVGYLPPSLLPLGDVLENQFLVSVTANVSSQNLNSTVTVTSACNVITGTNLNSSFSNNEYIVIYNVTSPEYFRVVSATPTTITLDSPAGFAGTCNIAKHYPAGYNFPLDNITYAGDRKVLITSETTFQVDTGAAFPASLQNSVPAVVQYRMQRTQATQAKKDVNKNKYVKLFANSSTTGVWNLGLPDVFKIKKVYASTSGYSEAAGNEVTDQFMLDNGQRPDYYDHAKLVLKPEYAGSFVNNEYFVVVLDHFTPNYTNGIGFFSVDSYSIDDVNTANTTAIQTAQIPIFNYENTTIDLRDAVDFRPYKANTAVSANTLAQATANPGTTVLFNTLSTKYMTEPDTTFQADVEYYLGRKDLITLNIGGALNVVKGTPSENPKIPQNTSDTMVLAVADVPPYPTLTLDQATEFGREQDAIKTEIYTNRVYTMRDIGVLDERIQNLEYYTSLAALEVAAKDLAVLDADGNNRFKNGIFVDPMTTYDFQSTADIEYAFTLDPGSTYGRSKFKQKEIELEYNEGASIGVQKSGRYLTRPYTDELFIFQPFATKFRNNAQDFWRWNGSAILYPGFDVNRTVQQGTTADFQFRIFMNSRNVSFVARGLKPNTKMYAYFDGIAVSQHCAPAAVNTQLGSTLEQAISVANRRGRPENALVRTANFGTQLTTDSQGNLLGIFRIPANTFKVGDRLFRLVDVDNLVTGSDAILTESGAIFTAYNVSVTVPPPPPPPAPERNTGGGARAGGNTGARRDPLAQSFFIEAPENNSGTFLTKIDLFFKKKDPNLGIEIVVVGMSSGLPNYNDVKGTARLSSSEVFVSDDASLRTTFKFDFPIFLTSNQEYAFYIVPEANSPEYQMWVCEIGDFDIITGAQVFQNPYSGEMFRSSNAGTWTPIPTEDIKFNLYVANFQVGTGTAYFQNEADDYLTLNEINYINPSTQGQISLGNEVYVITSNTDFTITAEYQDKEAYVQYIDADNKLILNDSKGVFRDYTPPVADQVIGFFNPPQQGNVAQCNSTTIVATAKVTSVDNIVMHSLLPKMLANVPSGTNVLYSFKGTSNSGVVETNYKEVEANVIKEMNDYERLVYSVSNENVGVLGKTLMLKAEMNNSNKYVSPIIDLTSKSIVAIENIINFNVQDERTRYGTAKARYISKPVVLAENQDAEDILVYLTGYRPINTEIDVYVKFLSSQDPASLDSKYWTKLNLRNPSLRSNSTNNLDFKEFVYELPTVVPGNDNLYTAYKNLAAPIPFDGIIEYRDESAAVYQTYKSFIVKIVLRSDNKVYVPKIDDIRVIALQV